jgi:hypothetical protein
MKELRGAFPESSTVGMNGYNAIGIMYAGNARKREVIDRRCTHIGKPAINFFSSYELVRAQKAAKVAKNSYKSKS